MLLQIEYDWGHINRDSFVSSKWDIYNNKCGRVGTVDSITGWIEDWNGIPIINMYYPFPASNSDVEFRVTVDVFVGKYVRSCAGKKKIVLV